LAKRPRQAPGLPSKAEILQFIQDSPEKVGKREIARAFQLTGDARLALKDLLRELEDEGRLERGAKRRFGPVGALPGVAVVEVIGPDEDGALTARPISWSGDGEPPRIEVIEEHRRGPALGRGDRVLARLARGADGYEARPIKKLTEAPDRVIGVVTQIGRGFRIASTDRKNRNDYAVADGALAGARKGDVVLAEVLPGRRLGLREARVVERLGSLDEPRALSLIAIHKHDIPAVFPPGALSEAKAAKPVRLGERTDLRDLPLVTIDGEDARDFDDAVHARRDGDGWEIVIAIADVAHYVRPGGELDREAHKRGNSVYFPDRVVPMLPEELSNDLCSLRPDEERACLAVRMRIGRDGRKRSHDFVRGLMRSTARLTYEEAQRARDGDPDHKTLPILGSVIEPLYGAYEARVRARVKRQPLDLDLPEFRVLLDEEGDVLAIRRRARLDSHKLIEEFMIAANVCAAGTLEAQKLACMYRVHDEPSRERARALKEYLDTIGLSFPLGEVLKPALFNRVLARARESGKVEEVSQAVLRTQAQAVYSPTNIGHFGLGLSRYAHFTSPIRRYSDLLVHRGLIRALKFGGDGLTDGEIERFAETAEHISNTERRAMAAEREALERYLAAWMADKVGATFEGRIAGVTRAGLFVKLNESGADGFAPIATLGAEWFRYDEKSQSLLGDRTKTRYTLGQPVEVKLVEATPVTGGLLFEVLGEGPPSGRRARRRR
jgi:ribonuclease R